jgi:glycosyltransferase involved in cell wall biosynthesis
LIQTINKNKLYALLQLLNNKHFDLIQFDLPENLSLAVALNHISIKKLLIHHEIKYERIQSHLKARSLNDPYLIYLTKLIKNSEIFFLNQYDGIVVFTDNDKERLNNNPKVVPDVFVSPFSVQTEDHGFYTEAKHTYKPNKIIFIGPSQHFPNYDSVEWMINNLYPMVQKKFKLPWYIIGKWDLTNNEIKRWRKLHNIYFTGFVPNLNSYLKNAIMMSPIRIGGGIKTKILIGLKNRIPVVGFPFSFEGIDVEHLKSAFVCHTKNEFIQSIDFIIKNPNESYRIACNGEKLVKQSFSIDRNGLIRSNVIKTILKPMEP